MKTALFPGTFDPFTLGHADLVERGLMIFDRIVIAIGSNSEKNCLFTTEQRIAHIQACYSSEPRIDVCWYEGLTIDCALHKKASFLLRGIRSQADFEYEKLLAEVNQRLGGIETVCLFTDPTLACIQSNVVRDLIKYGKDISGFVPEPILKLIQP
jgi:pantetheine-phosphate adenylyltransferase